MAVNRLDGGYITLEIIYQGLVCSTIEINCNTHNTAACYPTNASSYVDLFIERELSNLRVLFSFVVTRQSAAFDARHEMDVNGRMNLTFTFAFFHAVAHAGPKFGIIPESTYMNLNFKIHIPEYSTIPEEVHVDL